MLNVISHLTVGKANWQYMRSSETTGILDFLPFTILGQGSWKSGK